MRFASCNLYVGTFSCALDSSIWKQQHLHDRLTIGFPRAVARFRWEDGQEAFTNPNHVLFHDASMSYRIIDAGTAYGSVYIVPSEHLVEELASDLEVDLGDGVSGFPSRHGTVSAVDYLALHQLRLSMESSQPPDDLEIEETLLRLVASVVRGSYQRAGYASPKGHSDIVEETKEVVSQHLAESMSLDQIAARVHVSPYHLCRIFRRLTGSSIHEYRTQLRLREGLTALSWGADDISSVAYSLGFSTHSHFTHRFRQVFGIAPSQIRGAGARDHVASTSFHQSSTDDANFSGLSADGK